MEYKDCRTDTWDHLFPVTSKPTTTQVEDCVGSPFFRQMIRTVTSELHAKISIEYSGCSIEGSSFKGWNVKLKKGGTSLCTLYPKKGGFRALIIVRRENAEANFFIQACALPVREAYNAVNFFNGGKWLIVDVDSQRVCDDLLELIRFRATGKSKARR